jgi:hypothetical protein
MAYEHRRRIGQGIRLIGKKWHFLTLTAHENCRTSAASLWNLKQGFTKLIERLRRKHGTCHYVLVHEFHAAIAADGTRAYHMHILYQCDSPFWEYHYAPLRKKQKTPKRLQDIAAECGMGYQVDIQQVEDNERAASYVAKYIGKAMAEAMYPKRFKRVRYSQGFPENKDKMETELSWEAIESDRLSVRAIRSKLIDEQWEVKSNFKVEDLSSTYDDLLDRLE